ncbi:hypothetical protein OH460_07465 [Vibrio sp. Makdt]|uniref:hypothetical protein n=1 Tax=Vibrio sp. Makdt TaxID=2998828 RepID=UPI0022CD4BC5|nr:hypothetical protein [Vibrio sp. Makdt]MDA0152135.1 hypothetical protein [Vibrio sp. Makdt]
MSCTRFLDNEVNKSLLISLIREQSAIGKTVVYYSSSLNGSEGYLYVGSAAEILNELGESAISCEPSEWGMTNVGNDYLAKGLVDGLLFVSILNLSELTSIEFLNQQMMIRNTVGRPKSSSNSKQSALQKFLMILGIASAGVALIMTLYASHLISAIGTDDDVGKDQKILASDFKKAIEDLERAERLGDVSIRIEPVQIKPDGND